MGEMGGTGQGGDEDEDQFVVPGFGGYGTGGVVMPWGGKEEEETPTRGQGYHGGMNNGSGGGLGYDSFGRNHRSGGDRSHISTTTTTTTTTLSSAPPLGPSTSSTSSQSFPNMINTPGLNLPPSMDDSQDDFIPGLALPDGDLGGFSSAGGGGGGAYVAGRQNGPLPSQEDLYGHEDEHGGGNGSGGGGGFGWRGSGRSGGGAGGGSGGGGSGGGGGGGGGRRWGQRRRQH